VNCHIDLSGWLQAIFREELGLPDLELSPKLTPDDLGGWDSLGMVKIVAAVEREFSLEFEAVQIENIRSVGDLISMITA